LAGDHRRCLAEWVSGIILVEAGARLLPSFPEDLSDDATRRLEQLGVEVRLGAPVTAIDSMGVKIGPARIEARTVIWAAGVAASPAGHWIGAKCDRVGRIEVDPDLSVHASRATIRCKKPFLLQIEQLHSVTRARSPVTRNRTRPQWQPPS
jgi:NADH dehydrogenase FAD-containing subunit